MANATSVFVLLKAVYVIRIPLQHLPATFQILSVIIGTTNRVFIDVCKLCFNPGGVVSLLVEDGTHGMSDAVASNTTVIANTLKYLIDTGFTHGLSWVITTRKIRG